MVKVKFSDIQYKELAKYWFDLSKLIVASMILKLFEPQTSQLTLSSGITVVFGLIFAVGFALYVNVHSVEAISENVRILGMWFR